MVPLEKLTSIGYDPGIVKDRIEIATANGVILAPLVSIRGIECFGVKVGPIQVVGHDLPESSPIEGLLRLDFLFHIPAFTDFYTRIHKHLI